MDIFQEIRRDNLIAIKELVKEVEDLNTLKNENGESLLRIAIKSGASLEVFVELAEAGANIFEVDEEGVGLIDDAIKKGRLDIVKYLVEQGIDPNTTKRKSGFTPLMAAMAYGDEPITKYLIQERKVDPSIKDTFEKTAADYAKMTGYRHLIKYLEE